MLPLQNLARKGLIYRYLLMREVHAFAHHTLMTTKACDCDKKTWLIFNVAKHLILDKISLHCD